MAIRIGTSGFIYEHWRRRFYPPSARGSELELYARAFDTVELNVTFYRMPPSSTFRSWAARVPEGFLFAVKASRYLTHVRRLQGAGRPSSSSSNGPASSVALSADPHPAAAGPRAGPRGARGDPRRVPEDAAWPSSRATPSWFIEEVRRALADRNVALCVADRRGPITPLWRTADWTYLRFHAGGPRRGRAMARVSSTGGPSGSKTVGPRPAGFVYFNNDGNGCALRDASVVRSARWIGEASVACRACRRCLPTCSSTRASSTPTPRAAPPTAPGGT